MTEQPGQSVPLMPDEDDLDVRQGAARRHALWSLVVLGCVAVIVGCLMVLLGGGGGPTHHAIDLLPPVHTPTPTTTSSHAVAAQSTRTTGKPARQTSAQASAGLSSAGVSRPPAGPVRHGDPCSSAGPCLVDGDGGVLAAVDAYRAQHGLGPVPGGVTHDAQVCALNRGGGATCVPHYAWTTVPTQDGAKAVAKIIGFGSDWLLDKSTKTISVGWAYVSGQYECVLLKAP